MFDCTPATGHAGDYALLFKAENGSLDLTNDDIRLYLNRAAKGYPREWTHLYRADLPSVSEFELGGEGFYEEDKDFLEIISLREPSRLFVLPVRGVTWSDWGSERRVVQYTGAAEGMSESDLGTEKFVTKH